MLFFFNSSYNQTLNVGVSASGKLADFDSAIPRFESLHPNHFKLSVYIHNLLVRILIVSYQKTFKIRRTDLLYDANLCPATG